jgi:hypothetical protein
MGVETDEAGERMNVMTRSEMGKNLPAELTTMFRGAGFGAGRLARGLENVQRRGGRMAGVGAVGDTAQEIADMIKAGSQAIVPILAAQNPGTIYTTNPTTGQIMVYSQPTGSTANLPVGAGGGYGGPGFSAQTPLGSVAATGMGTGTLLVVGLVGLVAVMMLTGRGR